MDYYKKYFKDEVISLPVTESISERILILPLYPNMTSEEKIYLTESISEFFDSI
jgi:perosamine synthetase